MRLRTVKPGFFKNEALAEIPPLGRILFEGLWCMADREGRLEDRPKRIKAEVLPYDDCDSDALLDALAEHDFIIRYSKGGDRFIQVVNFTKHQNPHVKEPASVIPAPDEHHAITVQAPDEHSSSRADSGEWGVGSGELSSVSLSSKAEGESIGADAPLSSAAGFGQVYEAFEALVGRRKASAQRDNLRLEVDESGAELVLAAIQEALKQNASSWAYVKTVIDNCRAEGRMPGEKKRRGTPSGARASPGQSRYPWVASGGGDPETLAAAERSQRRWGIIRDEDDQDTKPGTGREPGGEGQAPSGKHPPAD
jgi:DnaD/phage-associated family protein